MMNFGFYNMDCMEGMKQFSDNFFDLAIVDPVYGDVTKGGYMFGKGGENKAKRKDYCLELWKQEKSGKEYFEELFRVSKNQIIWGGNYFTEFLPPSQGWIIWDKLHPDGVHFADCEMAWTSFNVATRIYRFLWNGMLQNNMKDKEFRIHPTQKPVALYEWILDRYAKKGDIIIDTHVGSGSSLIACRRKKYNYIGFEIEKEYFDMANNRIEEDKNQMFITDYGYCE